MELDLGSVRAGRRGGTAAMRDAPRTGRLAVRMRERAGALVEDDDVGGCTEIRREVPPRLPRARILEAENELGLVAGADVARDFEGDPRVGGAELWREVGGERRGA